MHHNPCFNLFIVHNIPFDNQGSEVNKNDIFLRFDKLSFIFICIILKLYICVLKDVEIKRLNFESITKSSKCKWHFKLCK